MDVPDWRQVARRKATKYGLDPDIFVAQIGAESGFNPNARSPAGALGIAQIMPATAQGWGVNPLRPRHALDAAAKNMAAYVKQYGGYENALRAYNAGPGNIQASHGFSETNAYVQKILHGQDPGGLGQPRQGNRNRGRGGGGRGPVTLSDVISTNGAVISPPADNGLLASLLEQTQPKPQVPVSAPDPVAFGADRYLRGASAGVVPSSPVAQAQQQGGLAAQLAALGGAPSITVPGRSQTVSTTGRAPGGPVGKTLVIGDSLGVGTVPELKELGVNVAANVKIGRSSQKGVSALRQALQGRDYQNIVFDLGTNDGSAAQLKTSLREALRLAPNSTIYVPTVNGPGAAAKNRVIRQFARRHDNVKFVPWHARSRDAGLTDGIHGGYDTRASILARALGARPDGGGSPKVGGPVAEMFYNGPGGINIDEGQRVGKGFVDGHTDHVHFAHNDPKTVDRIGRLAQQMGLHVSENETFDPVDPVHTQGSFHYRNRAIDVSGDPSLMLKFNRRVARMFGV